MTAGRGFLSEITYEVGDIHGCRDELNRLLDAIESDAAGRPRRLVFLGDFIDKGPDSAGVIARLMALQKREPDDVVLVKGNHDDLMLRSARGDEAAFTKWMTMDGASVLAQYGVAKAVDLPADVIAWIAAMPTLWNDEFRYFVHAGLDPSRPVSEQSDTVRMNMRGAFLERDFDFGRHVAHGHTPQFNGAPELRSFRSNLDTGVVQTGCLTAARFDPASGPPSTIIATRPEGRTVLTDVRNLS